MRAPITMPLGNDQLVLVQAGRTLSLGKPETGRAGILQIAPGETLDLSAIANETIALVKLGNRLVVLFQDRSYVVVDGLYLPSGDFTPGVRVALDGSTNVDTAQFASQFGVSTDESILTAAGITIAPRGAGGATLASAPPSSALNPESSLTPGDSGPSSTFGDLTQDEVGQPGFDPGTAAPNGTNTLAAVTPTDTTPAVVTPPAAVPTAPVASADAAFVTEAGVVSGGSVPTPGVANAGGNLLTNDTGDTALTVTGLVAGSAASASGNVGTGVAGQFGTLVVAGDGSYTYALNNGAAATQALAQGSTATDVFTYTVTDQNGQTSTTTVTITVNGTNDAPVITSETQSGVVTETGTNHGTPVPGIPTATGTLQAGDVDTGAVLTWSGNATGTYGNFAIDPTTGTWVYTINEVAANGLNSGQSVVETFTATVTDEFGATATQVVSITVNGADDTSALTFDLDTLAPGTGYVGLTQAEAAISRDPATVGAVRTDRGVSLGQTDESSALEPRPNNIAVGLSSPSEPIVTISATLGSVAGGDKGLLRVSDGFLALPSDSIVINDGAGTLSISYASGYSAADAAAMVASLRYVNTDTSFLLDTSDRTITVTITDQTGQTATATATIPVAADVTDFAGAAGINAFTGTRFSDRIIGLDGDDILDGGSGGNDYIDGGDNDDTITAADGDNELHGGDGDNHITAGNGDNLITAGSGDDVITVGNGDNTISAGDGDNTVTTGNGDNIVTTGVGDDRITTGDGDDTINAGDGSNVIFSGGGDDRITTGSGDDVINSGAGSDRISAGRGDDDITTGTGGDTIVYDSDLAQIGFDTLRDFESGADTLEFALSVVGGGLASGGGNTGELDASRFTTGASFTDTDQRFRYDSASKILFYDADGSGAGQAEIALAMVETGTIVASDIRIA